MKYFNFSKERVNERKVQFLKDQLNNGQLVKAALGQLTQVISPFNLTS